MELGKGLEPLVIPHYKWGAVATVPTQHYDIIWRRREDSNLRAAFYNDQLLSKEPLLPFSHFSKTLRVRRDSNAQQPPWQGGGLTNCPTYPLNWCSWRDSNPHAFRQQNLNLPCLPFHHKSLKCIHFSCGTSVRLWCIYLYGLNSIAIKDSILNA